MLAMPGGTAVPAHTRWMPPASGEAIYGFVILITSSKDFAIYPNLALVKGRSSAQKYRDGRRRSCPADP